MALFSAAPADVAAVPHAVGESQTLSASMPRLILEARRIAATIIHGLHGRRRAGTGENFWQFRRFVWGEPAARVDWRRSARDDFLYVREQEWEAAHTIWIWPDRSPSMAFRSSLAHSSKLDCALVMGFALADILVQSGERVGVPGLTRPTGSRNVVEKISQSMIHDPTKRTSLPTAFAPAPLAEMIMLSDLWSPIAEIKSTIGRLAATGSLGHIVQIVDPAEETFPYSGRIEFVEPEGAGSITTGRAENWRADYAAKVENHRAAIRAETDRLGWSFTIHRTDRPVTELLLKLHQRLAGERGGVGHRSPATGQSERPI